MPASSNDVACSGSGDDAVSDTAGASSAAKACEYSKNLSKTVVIHNHRSRCASLRLVFTTKWTIHGILSSTARLAAPIEPITACWIVSMWRMYRDLATCSSTLETLYRLLWFWLDGIPSQLKPLRGQEHTGVSLPRHLNHSSSTQHGISKHLLLNYHMELRYSSAYVGSRQTRVWLSSALTSFCCWRFNLTCRKRSRTEGSNSLP